ncbi:MAG: hypothetical protein JW779_11735 [Candidatus Thorarchaeota archaeon]|nr:hypothetical protein [Candidatus Thorarchaeota archaeon]
MGVALDSFVQVLTTAGFFAIIALVWSAFSRLRSKPGTRGTFQRLPLLLPAIVFVISLFLILELGFVPMSQYHGINSYSSYIGSDSTFRFNVYTPDIVYEDEVQIRVDSYLQPGEYIITVFDFCLDNIVVESILVNLTALATESSVFTEKEVDLDPGSYVVLVNRTTYEYGEIQDGDQYCNLRLSQPIQSSFQPEIIDWSTYQFFFLVGSFFVLLGGFCIGWEDRRDTRVDRKPEDQYEDQEHVEYGKGC